MLGRPDGSRFPLPSTLPTARYHWLAHDAGPTQDVSLPQMLVPVRLRLDHGLDHSRDEDVGGAKVEVAAARIRELNHWVSGPELAIDRYR